MDNNIEYGKVSAQLTLASLISGALSALLCGFIVGLLQIKFSRVTGVLLITVCAIVGMYLVTGWYLRRNATKWNLAFIDEKGNGRSFSGVAFATLMFGLYWRTILIGIVTGAVGAALKTMYGEHSTKFTDFGVDALASLFNVYIGYYWLLKAQYGSFKIVDQRINTNRSVLIMQGETSISDAKSAIKESVIGVLSTVAVLSYYGLGLVQIVATYDFFRHYWDWPWFFSGIASMFVGYTPVLGSIAGVMGAIKVWHWDTWVALLLFFYPFVIWIAIMILGGTLSLFGKAGRN